MWLADCHVHSHHSVDGSRRLEDYCRAAVAGGLKAIIFTEHYDLNPVTEGFNHLHFARYAQEVEAVRQKFAGRLEIGLGLELGEPHLYAGAIDAFLSGKKVDFLLGSVHWVGEKALHLDYGQGCSAEEAYQRYFEEVLRAVQAGNFHVLAHLDLLKRYLGHQSPLETEHFREIITAILQEAISRGIGLEVNTSGLRQGLADTLPGLMVLKWYRDLGGEIVTLGSDAHRPEDVGAGLATGLNTLAAAGFTRAGYYQDGQVRMNTSVAK